MSLFKITKDSKMLNLVKTINYNVILNFTRINQPYGRDSNLKIILKHLIFEWHL